MSIRARSARNSVFSHTQAASKSKIVRDMLRFTIETAVGGREGRRCETAFAAMLVYVRLCSPMLACGRISPPLGSRSRHWGEYRTWSARSVVFFLTKGIRCPSSKSIILHQLCQQLWIGFIRNCRNAKSLWNFTGNVTAWIMNNLGFVLQPCISLKRFMTYTIKLFNHVRPVRRTRLVLVGASRSSLRSEVFGETTFIDHCDVVTPTHERSNFFVDSLSSDDQDWCWIYQAFQGVCFHLSHTAQVCCRWWGIHGPGLGTVSSATFDRLLLVWWLLG